MQSSFGPWVDISYSALVSIRNARADIVGGDDDLNDTHWYLGEGPGIHIRAGFLDQVGNLTAQPPDLGDHGYEP
jgi:hypothetical protein